MSCCRVGRTTNGGYDSISAIMISEPMPPSTFQSWSTGFRSIKYSYCFRKEVIAHTDTTVAPQELKSTRSRSSRRSVKSACIWKIWNHLLWHASVRDHALGRLPFWAFGLHFFAHPTASRSSRESKRCRLKVYMHAIILNYYGVHPCIQTCYYSKSCRQSIGRGSYPQHRKPHHSQHSRCIPSLCLARPAGGSIQELGHHS